jgi:hypothetical protein
MKVFYFQRQPREGSNFSLEFHFQSVRDLLVNRIETQVVVAPVKVNGVIQRLRIILNARKYRYGDLLHNTGKIHFANFLLPKRKNVLTVLDCGLLANRTPLKQAILKWVWLTLPCWRSSFVTVISEATKRELMKEVNIAPEKVAVIPVFVSKPFVPASSPQPSDKVNPVLLQVGTTTPFLPPPLRSKGGFKALPPKVNS